MATFRTRPPLFLLPSLSTLVLAHGGHDAIPTGSATSLDPIDSILWTHILLQTLAWGILFPTGMVLGLTHSRFHVPVQVLATLLAVLGYFLGHLHKGRQFAHNAHASFANILMLLLIIQVSLGVFLRLHLERRFTGKSMSHLRLWLSRSHLVLGALIPLISWVQMLLGGIAALGFCRGDHLGQCLAHFIMGSAFIAYGIILTLLLLNGQAWLARTRRSQEFWDSCVIAVWGCVNTFTEHRWGGPWVRNDLQHTSMGVIWWAAGLVGIWLSRDRSGRPKRNIIPGIVILLTGWGMSAHPQSLELSTHVHAIFGYTLMAAGLTRIIEISFILRDKVTLVPASGEGDVDDEINSWQYLPVFLLYASGFLFMGATEEQMQLLSDAGVTHVSYILLLYSISFLLFLFVLMLLHLYSHYTTHAPSSKGLPTTKPKDNDDTVPRTNGHGHANGHATSSAADRQAHDAQEFELEGLMSDDDDDTPATRSGAPSGRLRV